MIDRKARRMKQLTDNLFEYSLVTGENEVSLEEPELLRSVYRDGTCNVWQSDKMGQAESSFQVEILFPVCGGGNQMNVMLLPVEQVDLKQYKADLQEAFQKGYEDQFGKTDEIILPEEDIEESLHNKGAAAYKAVVDGEMVGGAVVFIDEKSQHNDLAILYVKYGIQGKGIGKKIWFGIEKLYPETKVWETCTPCFEKRNIHFYVNVCGFRIVSSFRDPQPGCLGKTPDDGGDNMYGFRKQM